MEDSKKEASSISALVSMEKIEAFKDSYTPCANECVAQEMFTDARLRDYFGAYYAIGIGDPLPAYVKELAEHGFSTTTSLGLGVPAIMVRYAKK